MQEDPQEKKFLVWLNKLKREVRDAHIHFKLCESLSSASGNYGREMDRARCFFTMTIYAHLEASLIHVLKVIDKRSDLNIWKFFGFVGRNLNLFTEERVAERVKERLDVSDFRRLTGEDVEADRNRLEEFRSTMDNLKEWRDKEIAHLDHEAITSDLSKDYPVRKEDFTNLISICLDVLNHYSGYYNRTQTALDPLGIDDWESVLRSIRYYISNHSQL